MASAPFPIIIVRNLSHRSPRQRSTVPFPFPLSLTQPTPALHRRAYHSYEQTPEPPYPPHEDSILSAALAHVPTHGFTTAALQHGARDAGYLDVTANMFPKGAYEMVRYHCVRERLGLKDRVQFPTEKMGVGSKVRSLVLARLRANAERRVVGRWQEALALMAVPSHIRPSLRELSLLADEIWFLAGDTSVDTSWYTKRASLASIYAATELFMTSDASTSFSETEKFLDRRLQDVRVVGGGVGNVAEWVGFTGRSVVNLLRSKGVRI